LDKPYNLHEIRCGRRALISRSFFKRARAHFALFFQARALISCSFFKRKRALISRVFSSARAHFALFFQACALISRSFFKRARTLISLSFFKRAGAHFALFLQARTRLRAKHLRFHMENSMSGKSAFTKRA